MKLGIIEGFYGPQWSWASREYVVTTLAPHGYDYYLYAPKADASLRERWREPLTHNALSPLSDFATVCRQNGVRFGMGLSPIGALEQFDSATRALLAARLEVFDHLGVQDLAIQFDDVQADLPDLAARQAELMHWIRRHTSADRLILCPSYYSDDPMLDQLFGPRPEGYLDTLGRELQTGIDVFWAGEEICARQFSPGHLRRVTDQLQRKPFIWDNYPVNDSEAMADHLHLRGFTGRPSEMAEHCAGHAINPALQPVLSCIPALTLPQSYSQGDNYAYMEATHQAMTAILGQELGDRVFRDIVLLQDEGRNAPAQTLETLRARYGAENHPGAEEIARWLAHGR